MKPQVVEVREAQEVFPWARKEAALIEQSIELLDKAAEREAKAEKALSDRKDAQALAKLKERVAERRKTVLAEDEDLQELLERKKVLGKKVKQSDEASELAAATEATKGIEKGIASRRRHLQRVLAGKESIEESPLSLVELR